MSVFGLALAFGPSDSLLMTYLLDHWHGRHALPRAFWVNFLVPFVLIAMADSWIRPAASDASIAQIVAVSLYFLLAYALVLPWQVIGLWRSTRRHLKEGGDIGTVTFAQAAALVALVVAAGLVLSAVQRMTGLGRGIDDETIGEPPRYRFEVRADDGMLVIDGPFDIGLSRDLEALLAKTVGIGGIVLNSDGGRVFEARGVARQILENALDTYVFDHCRSACTIAFIAGTVRRLGKNGQLGFHSYGLEAPMAFIDPEEEQEKDKAFFVRHGVMQDFVEQAFDVPHDDMWHPDADELRRANVVHETLTE